MKILYVCGTYCPSHAGAEISAHTTIKYLQDYFGVDVAVVTDERYISGKELGSYEGVKLYGSSHEKREDTIQKATNEFKPDIIFTQLMWSNVALELAKKNKIRSVLRICKIPFQMDIRESSIYTPTAALVVSKAVNEYIKENYLQEGTIIYPPVSFDKVLVINQIPNFKPEESKFITMFNPLERKGAKIIKEVAKTLLNLKFAIVPGWTCLKESANSDVFSPELIRRMCDSLGIKFAGKIPEYVDFSDCPNVVKLDPTDEVWKIYKETRILLVPSQWEEAFGRVAVEGMVNGIQVIGSNIGGLREAIGAGGILIDNYKEPLEWINAIKSLESLDNYRSTSEREIKTIKDNYSLKGQVKKYLDFFNEVITKKV